MLYVDEVRMSRHYYKKVVSDPHHLNALTKRELRKQL